MHVLVKTLHELQQTLKESPVPKNDPPTIDLTEEMSMEVS